MNSNNEYRFLITGAAGQIGTALRKSLIDRYGKESVIATDLREDEKNGLLELDVLDYGRLEELVEDHDIHCIIHLAAILSAKGESNPAKTWEINVNGLLNVLEIARLHRLQVFNPSSIAVFGGDYDRTHSGQEIALLPETMYGVTKVAGEQLCRYYQQNFNTDIRSLRFPGLIGPDAMPGGGTTDYAVAIFHELIQHKQYDCYLSKDTAMPMMYMPDATRSIIELLDADLKKLNYAYGYNLQGMSFTPEELYNKISAQFPGTKINYSPDARQKIADSWPHSVDDTAAQSDWNWKAEYGLDEMVNEMMTKLTEKYNTHE